MSAQKTIVGFAALFFYASVGLGFSVGDHQEDQRPLPSIEVENAPSEVIVEIDPHELAIANAKAGYVSYYTMGLIQSTVGDSSTIDDEF